MQEHHSLTTSVILPRTHDVIAGQGRVSQSHPGNVKYQQVLAQTEEKFSKALTKEKKQAIAQAAIYEIESVGGRFLRFDNVRKQWLQLSEAEVYAKVSQALRYRKRQIQREHRENDSDSKARMSIDDVFKKHSLGWPPRGAPDQDLSRPMEESWQPNPIPLPQKQVAFELLDHNPLTQKTKFNYDPGTSSQQEQILLGDTMASAHYLQSRPSVPPEDTYRTKTKHSSQQQSSWTLTGNAPTNQRPSRPIIESPHFTTEQLLQVLRATVFDTNDEYQFHS